MAGPDPFILYVALPLSILLWLVLSLRLRTFWRAGIPIGTHTFQRGSPAWRA